ncbi:uncharacterized protein [Haliotis cracherodii]|uniref:uncharacterized protein n=1 Tax=Haliotis cracherodii TaxID=6455 RepID=UPI0039EC9927
MWLELVLMFQVSVFVGGAKEADENGLCLKEEVLGEADGNTYYCNDPELPLCCQTDDTHKCCEAEDEKTFKDQVMLWGFVCLTILSFALVFCLLTREGDFFQAETCRQAADRVARKCGIKCFAREKKEDLTNKRLGRADLKSSREELQSMPLAWF